MNRSRYLIVGGALLGLLAGGALYAQGPGPGGPGRRGVDSRGVGRGGGLPLRALNLTDAQREQVRALREQHQAETRGAAEKLRSAREAQRRVLATIPAEESLVRSTSQELGEAQTEMALQRARLQAEIFALLTPEQQAAAKKLQADRAVRMQQRETRMRQGRQQQPQQQPN